MAKEHFKAAINCDKRNIEPLCNYVLFWLKRGKLCQAKKYLKKAQLTLLSLSLSLSLVLHPRPPTPLCHMYGTAPTKIAKYTQAQTLKTLFLHPSSRAELQGLHLRKEHRVNSQNIRALNEQTEGQSENIYFKCALGLYCSEIKKYKEASIIFESAIEICAYNKKEHFKFIDSIHRIMYFYGMHLQYKTKEFERAKELYEDILENYRPFWAEVYYHLALCWESLAECQNPNASYASDLLSIGLTNANESEGGAKTPS